MKRSRIRTRRSRPRPPDDDTLYDRYGDAHQHSEFAKWLGFTILTLRGKFVPDEVNRLLEPGEFWGAERIVLERHHLWSIGRRPDLWSNLLVVTGTEHKFLEKHKEEGRLLASLAKLRKRFASLSSDEFTASEIHTASGIWIGGYLETTPFDFDLLPNLWRLRAEAVGLARLAEIEDE